MAPRVWRQKYLLFLEPPAPVWLATKKTKLIKNWQIIIIVLIMTDDLSIDDETPPLLAVADSDIIVKVYKLHLLEHQQHLIQGFGV